jgi:hypothetical protein
MKYTDNIHLINYIESDNIFRFKEELLNSIFFLKGNREELDKVIELAVRKSSFRFDIHQEIDLNQNLSFEDKYAQETLNMKENFSKERLNYLLEIYDTYYSKKEYSYDIPESTKKSSNVVVAVVVVGIAIASLVLYKILN